MTSRQTGRRKCKQKLATMLEHFPFETQYLKWWETSGNEQLDDTSQTSILKVQFYSSTIQNPWIIQWNTPFIYVESTNISWFWHFDLNYTKSVSYWDFPTLSISAVSRTVPVKNFVWNYLVVAKDINIAAQHILCLKVPSSFETFDIMRL